MFNVLLSKIEVLFLKAFIGFLWNKTNELTLMQSDLPAEADKIISMTQEIVIRLSSFKMHLANYFIVTMAAVCQAQMAPSFHSINAALGLLFQEAALDVNWQQLLAVLGWKARIHLLCSCFPELQLSLRTAVCPAASCKT